MNEKKGLQNFAIFHRLSRLIIYSFFTDHFSSALFGTIL